MLSIKDKLRDFDLTILLRYLINESEKSIKDVFFFDGGEA